MRIPIDSIADPSLLIPDPIQVLLIEDNAADVRLAQESLRGAGREHVRLTHVDRLSSAVEHLASEKIDAILLDLSLPDGQGLEGMMQIHMAYPHLPIVVLSGDQDDSLALKALGQGAQDYLKKGESDGTNLIRAIRYAIERQRAEDRLAYLATHDPLTGLANRTLLRDRLEHALARARRFNHPVYVLYLDLDGFKIANDSYGHTVGDHLLQAAADRLGACVRRADTAARVGGDEFVVILEATSRVNDIESIAQKILNSLARPFEIQEHRILLTCSIGLVGFPKDGDSVDQLLSHADTAMYRAKEAGGHQTMWYTSPDRSSRTVKLNLGQDFRKALARNELVVYYQPQLNLRTNTVSSVKALLRWNHPSAGLLLPAMFVPVAEHGGQMPAVEQWLLETAARQYQRWKDESIWSFRLCMNIFSWRLSSEHVAEEFIRSIDGMGISPADVAVELPSSSIGVDLERGCSIVGALQRQGIQIVLANVGTKAWSLDAMRRLPWDILKIDPSLVQSSMQVPADAAMVRMLMSLGSDLRRRVVAEGVADLTQLKHLLSVGCGEATGDLICPPMSAQDMTYWLTERNSPPAFRAA